MGNCIRTEMWKAFHNKMMRSALLIGFILVIADLVQTAITVSDLGASYAHSPGGYDGCSLFVNWIGVNGVTVGAVVFYAVWPFLAAMPYGWSLYEDNRSHMTNNILTRVPYSQYLTAKMAAVFVSGGIHLFRYCYNWPHPHLFLLPDDIDWAEADQIPGCFRQCRNLKRFFLRHQGLRY